jgi:hypothetical protein
MFDQRPEIEQIDDNTLSPSRKDRRHEVPSAVVDAGCEVVVAVKRAGVSRVNLRKVRRDLSVPPLVQRPISYLRCK